MRWISVLVVLSFLFCSIAALAWQKPTDDQIYDNVRRRLANDPDVKGGTFEVEVKEGIVTIKGVVEKEKWKSKAERVAKKEKGVKGVNNQLVVKPRVS